jgi:hypothetical protein
MESTAQNNVVGLKTQRMNDKKEEREIRGVYRLRSGMLKRRI